MKNLKCAKGGRRALAGFTLIELMIAVAVVAILAAIAYPSYLEQIRKSRRTDAKAALLDLAARQERYFTTHNTYTKTAADLGYANVFPIDVKAGNSAFYQLNVSVATTTAFTATATPVGAQTADTKCGTYTIDDQGSQSSSGTLGAAGCW
ncbi:type IV pilin protein [Variovorax sp. Sphag1AA]|uniref:type IV pilin protein n=1 Tax=Variovorax sp. Sphag1AA TaxID=2587027 RepID=UPI001615EC11|nr:type IV pilin protein [Variovorax sp. Sphag1AA]MBB3180503.1 type IV pilus assembly protein PilE [Variovorax sp. Sphag1AA]